MAVEACMTDAQWHVAIEGRQEGPVDEATLVAGLGAGRWPTDALVWKEGMSGWVPASSVPELTPAGGSGGGGSQAPGSGTTPRPAAPAAAGAGLSSSAARPSTAHEIDYVVHGDEMQFVEVELDPGETVVAEAGAMMYMDARVQMETRFGDGSDEDKGFLGKALSAGKRLVTGESLFMTHFTGQGQGRSRIAFASPYPGKIIPLDLGALGGEILCQKDAFLCAAKGTTVGVAFTKKFGAGLFGGEGFILQRLTGDGLAFVHAGGTVVERTLSAGEVLKLDTGCIVAMQPSVDYDIQMVKGVKSMVFGGEGLFFATLKGPGHVWLQSLPFSRLAGRLASAAGPGRGKGEGSVLGTVGTLLGGD